MWSLNKIIKIKDNKKTDTLHNPEVLGVNLVREESLVFFDWVRHLLILVLMLGVASFLVAEIYFGLSWWERKEAISADKVRAEAIVVKEATEKLKQNAAAALSYKDRSTAFGQLLDNHIYWSNFFSWLEKNTLSSVKYEGFSGDVSGLYSLGARANDYAEVSWQVKAFQLDPLTEKVEVLNAAAATKDKEILTSDSVSFSLNLQVKPEMFKTNYDQSSSQK